MNLKDFTNIAKYCNDNWKGNFSDQEIKRYAQEYYEDYIHAKDFGIEVGTSLDSLIEGLVEDYVNTNDEATERMIGDWLEDIAMGIGISGYDPFSSLMRAYGVSGY